MPLRVLIVVLLTLPWLWPFTSGPLSAAEPYLVAAACAGLVLILWPGRWQEGALLAADSWLVAALLSSAIALLQYFHLEAPLHPWVNLSKAGQAFGNLRQPNQLATLLVLGLLALHWRARRLERWRGWALALAVPLLVALAATASRTGLVELLAAMVLLVWFSRGEAGRCKGAAALAFLALCVYALAALALPWALQLDAGQTGRSLIDRLQHAESTCGSRLILWRNVLALIALKPWTGWGWGELDWAHLMTPYEGARFCHILDNAHNLPLHLAVELGVPVALVVCALALWLAMRARPWAEQDATRQLAWGALAAIGIHSLVEYPLWYGPFQMASAMAIGVLVGSAAAVATAADQGAPARRLGSPVRKALGVLVLLATAYAAWDYRRVSQLYLPQQQRAAAYQVNTLEQARRSWLYADAVRFAVVTTHAATPQNAGWLLAQALQALHFSPEPSVIERVIESAVYAGRLDLARQHLARFDAAFASDAAKWRQEHPLLLQTLGQ
ncbi:MAG: Wzy polymerase domain-containing protein [Burkholderiaceae bacterium]|jgi:O-antigen ligase|nr:Wzy polymerase domain-containing protein [Burkholderiaceae bacterium]